MGSSAAGGWASRSTLRRFAAQRYMVDAVTGEAVIVATQMLDSMMRQPRQRRSDRRRCCRVDGADAVMLSGETAAGKYPIESLQAMKSIIGRPAIIDGKRRARRLVSYARRQKSANVVPSKTWN